MQAHKEEHQDHTVLHIKSLFKLIRRSYMKVGHEVSEDGRALLLQQTLQADDERNRVLNEGLLLDLWTKSRKLREAHPKVPNNVLQCCLTHYQVF